MEAIGALSLACNVIQVVDYAIATTRVIKDVYKQGGTSNNQILEDVSNRLDLGAAQVEQCIVSTTTVTPPSSTSIEIKNIAQDLRNINRKLQEELLKLKRNDSGLRSTLKTTFKTLTKHNLVQDLEKRLNEHQRVLSFRILADMWQRVKDNTVDLEVSRLIDSLHYLEIHQRINQIQLVEQESFEWLLEGHRAANEDILTPTAENDASEGDSTKIPGSVQLSKTSNSNAQLQTSYSVLRSWLQQDSRDMFWINGKAGSGKSTLMKKIWDHPKTMQLLELQFHPRKPCILRYSFWLSGSVRQRSLQSLLSSLLYQLLSAYPILAQAVLQNAKHMAWKRNYDDWSVKELQEQLLHILQKSADMLKVCIFVDGLDECDPGDGPRELAKTLDVLVNQAHTKLCVSSRPEPFWSTYFLHTPQLCLQNLTRGEIERYVSGQLKQVSFPDEGGNATYTREHVVREVVIRAQGVFLWARTVTQILLRGLDSMASWTEIWNRLRQMPREMEALYEDMLSRLGPDLGFTVAELATYLRACLVHNRGSTKVTIALIANLRFKMDGVLEEWPQFYTLRDLVERCEKSHKRLMSICTGFLEVRKLSQFEMEYYMEYLTGIQESKFSEAEPSLFYGVEIHHRSVRDFLVDTSAGQTILGKCALVDESILDTYIQTILQWWHIAPTIFSRNQRQSIVSALGALCVTKSDVRLSRLEISNNAICTRLYFLGRLMFTSDSIPDLLEYRRLTQENGTEHRLALLISCVQKLAFVEIHGPDTFTFFRNTDPGYDCLGVAACAWESGAFDDSWNMLTSTPEISHCYASYLLLCKTWQFLHFPQDQLGAAWVQLLSAGASSYMTFHLPWQGYRQVSTASRLLECFLDSSSGTHWHPKLFASVQDQLLDHEDELYALVGIYNNAHLALDGSVPLGMSFGQRALWLEINLPRHFENILKNHESNEMPIQNFLSAFGSFPGDRVLFLSQQQDFTYEHHGIIPSDDLVREFRLSMTDGMHSIGAHEVKHKVATSGDLSQLFRRMMNPGLPDSQSHLIFAPTLWEKAGAELSSNTDQQVKLQDFFQELGYVKDPSDPAVLKERIPPFDPMPERQEELDALISRLSQRFRDMESSEQFRKTTLIPQKPRIWFPPKSDRVKENPSAGQAEELGAIRRRSTEFFDAEETQLERGGL